MAVELPFEQPLTELRSKIDELQKFGLDKKIDFTEEIRNLQERYVQIEDELYQNLTVQHKIQLAKFPLRPTTLDYIHALFSDFTEFHGDRLFGDDLAIVGGIARFRGIPITVVGHQKGKDTKDNIARNFGMPHPEGFRKALRLMQQANKFKRPIITFIDVAGAYPGATAEERGQAEAIARNLREMSSFTVPIICVIIGEGGSGGALALGVGNIVLMLEHAIYSVISPEGAASILFKDASKSLIAAGSMKITAQDIKALGVIDDIVPEPRGGAHRDKEQQVKAIEEYLWKYLQPLLNMSETELREHRFNKFRAMGEIALSEGSNDA